MNLFKKMFSSVEDGVAKMTRDKKVQKWLDEIEEAGKREQHFLKEAHRVVKLFEMQTSLAESEKPVFNVLYANTETLAPAVYNNTPRPVVKRKIQKNQPLSQAAALTLQKTLEFLVDSNDRTQATFDDLQKIAVQEALVPGRGLARFTYDADISKVPDPMGGPEQERLNSETIAGNSVPWDRVRFGYAKQWHMVPWVAFEHFMTRAELLANFGKEGEKVKLTHAPEGENEKNDQPADAAGVKFAHIWEIWDKNAKKVCFVSEGAAGYLKEVDDPLNLAGFFPNPRPICFLQKISSLVPTVLFTMYEQQAKELDDVTYRIGRLTNALKVRGFYDGTLAGLDELLKKPDNTLIPAPNVAAMQQGQTLEKAIWLMPLQEIVAVLQQLYVNRTQIQGVIHQLTGIADIMRGSSQASETLGAQKMKESWGTMRLKRMQKEVQRFSRECFRIQAELAAKHFSIETFVEMTGLEYPRAADKEQAQALMQQMQMVAQQQAMMAQQQPPQPGQPPQQPPGPSPEQQQQMQKAQATLAQPSWEEITDLLKNDNLRNYVIDIETNSTVDIEATEDKQELAEFMNSFSQLMNGVLPMVKDGILPFAAGKALMLSIVQKFRLGGEVEETLGAMQEPKPQEDPKAAAEKVKAQAEQAKMAAEEKRDAAKFGMEQQAAQQEIENKRQIARMELENRRAELALEREETELRAIFMREKHTMDMQMLTMKAAMPAKEPTNANV